MDFIKRIQKKIKYNSRVLEIDEFLQNLGESYTGDGAYSVVLEITNEKGKKAYLAHFVITQKPFIDLKPAVVMAAICSFSVKITDEDYSLHRLWFDIKADNWKTRLLETTDRAELERRIHEEWDKGTEGEFFH